MLNIRHVQKNFESQEKKLQEDIETVKQYMANNLEVSNENTNITDKLTINVSSQTIDAIIPTLNYSQNSDQFVNISKIKLQLNPSSNNSFNITIKTRYCVMVNLSTNITKKILLLTKTGENHTKLHLQFIKPNETQLNNSQKKSQYESKNSNQQYVKIKIIPTLIFVPLTNSTTTHYFPPILSLSTTTYTIHEVTESTDSTLDTKLHYRSYSCPITNFTHEHKNVTGLQIPEKYYVCASYNGTTITSIIPSVNKTKDKSGINVTNLVFTINPKSSSQCNMTISSKIMVHSGNIRSVAFIFSVNTSSTIYNYSITMIVAPSGENKNIRATPQIKTVALTNSSTLTKSTISGNVLSVFEYSTTNTKISPTMKNIGDRNQWQSTSQPHRPDMKK